MQINQTDDIEAIRKILTHPKVIKMATDDFSKDPVFPEGSLYIINEEKTGFVRIDPLNQVCCIAHVAALPELWGKADRMVKDAIRWVIENTSFVKAVVMIPAFNRPAIALCLRCKFEIEGLIRNSYVKDWDLCDQVVMGLTKEDFLKGR